MTVKAVAYENDDDILVLPAYADYSEKQYRAMYLYTDGRAKICAAHADAIGVLLDKPDAQDVDCRVKIRGVVKGILGAGVSAGNALMTDGDGAFIAQTTTLPKVGVALRGGSTNDIIPILLGGAGVTQTGTVAAPPGVMEFRIPLASVVTTGDLKTGIKVPAAGSIIDMQVDVDVVDNLSNKSATLGLKVGATAVTGAEVAITSATLTPVLTTIDSTAAASANNAFGASDTLRIYVKTCGAAFTASTGWITVRILTSS